MKFLSLFACLILFAIPVLADEQHHHHTEGSGIVNFKTSCTPEAQAQFNQAAAVLHSFGYERALIAFQDVAKTDPSCAMAYWGIAMTYYHPVWAPPGPEDLRKGKEAIEKAKMTGEPSEREKGFIDALDIFYKDYENTDHKIRAQVYLQAMKELAGKYPDDDEATIFYALALRGTASPMDKTYAIQKQSAEILNQVLKKEPKHPGIAHYIIHDYDYPSLAELALPAARVYAKFAPDEPHALHMPSHIFTRLGYWKDSIESNAASAKSAVEHTQKLHPGAGSFDQLHAMDYLIYAHLQLGQDDKAKQVLDEMNRIVKLDQNQFAAAYAFAAAPIRFAIERGRWSDAANIRLGQEWFPWQNFPWAKSIVYFGRSVGAARTGKVEQARADLQEIQRCREDVVAAKTNDWLIPVQVQEKAASAWIALAEKKQEEALKLMQAAADLEDSTDKHPVTPGPVIPARELYADMLMELKKPAEALVQYEMSMKIAPNRFYALSRAAKAAKLTGDAQKAQMYYSKLVDLCGSNCGRPEVTEAKAK